MSFVLSHSSYGRFTTCAKSFQFHYIDKLRPEASPSHLFFGGAIDKACEILLMDMQGEERDSEAFDKAVAACDAELDKLLTKHVLYRADRDYDRDLLDDAAKASLKLACEKIAGRQLPEVDSLVASLADKSQTEMSAAQKKVFALCCVTSLKAKAALMIEAYRKTLLPHIKRVVSTQSKVEWSDKFDNKFIGILDAEVELEGVGVIPADNKTASRAYEDDAVTRSTQLAIYSAKTGATKAAFFVMDKTIRKNRVKLCSICGHNGSKGRHKTCDANTKDGERCNGEWNETIQPEARVQIIIDDVPKRLQDITLEALTETAQAIKSNYFPRNLNACDNQYGSPCPYREYCWRNDKTGLVVETKDKK